MGRGVPGGFRQAHKWRGSTFLKRTRTATTRCRPGSSCCQALQCICTNQRLSQQVHLAARLPAREEMEREVQVAVVQADLHKPNDFN